MKSKIIHPEIRKKMLKIKEICLQEEVEERLTECSRGDDYDDVAHSNLTTATTAG